MKKLNEAILNLAEVRELLENMDAGRCPAAMSGLESVHRAHLAAAIHEHTDRRRMEHARSAAHHAHDQTAQQTYQKCCPVVAFQRIPCILLQ